MDSENSVPNKILKWIENKEKKEGKSPKVLYNPKEKVSRTQRK
jgi:hypothetical protein